MLPPPPQLPPAWRDVAAQAERTWPPAAPAPTRTAGQPPGCTAVVAVMDRVTMGGGVGMAVHGPFRIATERCARSLYSKLCPRGLAFSAWALTRLLGTPALWRGRCTVLYATACGIDTAS